MVSLQMSPTPGTRLVRFAGDCVRFSCTGVPANWKAFLRTNLGRADRVRDEIVRARFEKLPLAGATWRDLPLKEEADGVWSLVLPVTEVGYFKAKVYTVDERGFQHWPGGPDAGISVHPSWTRTGNTIYCAFPRMFGPSKFKRTTEGSPDAGLVASLDSQGYTVIPPSGKLRDVQRELPHIIERLGCRIIHLLPVSPTPTTFARFGRFGSPYALQHLTAIDPALVEFDKRTTGVDQFKELAFAIHSRGAKLMLDLVINHTGWGSSLWEEHPEWFVKKPDGEFECPGAWDVVWEDLVELDQRHPELWEHLAEAFLIWCRRGVDAFRCDAGYKVPTHVWQYITARVRQEYPDTVFLLEGLGGPWEATESLLTEGGMQWAYSELFQNEGALSIGGYLDHSLNASESCGTLVHYSETHDNLRLAARPKATDNGVEPSPNVEWSRLRNSLCALTSICGGFGFTSGVEWAATERINVHSSRGLAWASPTNLVPDLARLNGILRDHPCFFDGAKLTRVSANGAPIYALRRDSAEGCDSVLILINTDPTSAQSVEISTSDWNEFVLVGTDLLRPGQRPHWIPETPATIKDAREVYLGPGECICLASSPVPKGLSGDRYRKARMQADWAIACWWTSRLERPEAARFDLPREHWQEVAAEVEADPVGFLARALGLEGGYRPVIVWRRNDRHRVSLVPSGHWFLVRDEFPFRARLVLENPQGSQNVESIPIGDGYAAVFPPHSPELGQNATLELERYNSHETRLSAQVRLLGTNPGTEREEGGPPPGDRVVLLTNGRGSMARLRVDLGSIQSKYDCLLGANLHTTVPVDRHVFVKRVRVWVNADGFITPLNATNLVDFEAGPPAHWRFVANAGDGRSVQIHLVADFVPNENTVVLRFIRPVMHHRGHHLGQPLPETARVSLTVRVDIEDRSFHAETKFHPGADSFFRSTCQALATTPEYPARCGFRFAPTEDRHLQVFSTEGNFHMAPEWSLGISHSVEASRGQEAHGDAYSPGWFEIPLESGKTVSVVTTAEATPPGPAALDTLVSVRNELNDRAIQRAGLQANDLLARRLVLAAQAFLVRRDDAKTVIAGYPWFLDWGRDSLIAARGLLAAGLVEEVLQLLVTFARFEKNGTLPNSIHGENASNRDTVDAPLWFGIVCEEYGQIVSAGLHGAARDQWYGTKVDPEGRTIDGILRSIACGYLAGTANGIRVDAASGLVWGPSHFTWMDTNHPAGTPREGYAVEIQVLWIRLLRQLARRNAAPWEGRGESWSDLARRAEKSFHLYFWLEECGWYADVLLGSEGTPARTAPPSNALRSNCLLTIALDVGDHPNFSTRAKRMVDAATEYLLVPGALRSLAPLPVIPPLPIRGAGGGLLNDPGNPYWPRYEGDEDSRRKPAYHNGTAWVWTLPTFIEALVKAYPDAPFARAAARAYLGEVNQLLEAGCLGQLPEVIDGNAPHYLRGCDAQAWSVTEALRVWRLLK
jgi:predicted glycogen debranching enzyme